MRSIPSLVSAAGLLCGSVHTRLLPGFPASNVSETFFGTRVVEAAAGNRPLLAGRRAL
jgi:hypothetical protein